MITPFKKFLLAPALVLCLTASICTGAASFAVTLRVALAAGAPVLDLLERQGKISHETRVGLVADLSNEALRVGDMATCFDAIPKGDAQSKLKHLQCVQTLDQAPETRKLLSDFGANPTVQNIADDIQAVLDAALIFYGAPNKSASIVAGGQQQAITESEINVRVRKLKADLGQK